MPMIILTLKYHSDDININPYYYSYYNVLLNELIGGWRCCNSPLNCWTIEKKKKNQPEAAVDVLERQ